MTASEAFRTRFFLIFLDAFAAQLFIRITFRVRSFGGASSHFSPEWVGLVCQVCGADDVEEVSSAWLWRVCGKPLC
jgi:hypothetical protein